MKTIEKKDTATVSIDRGTYALAVKMAEAEGITTDTWLEQLVREKTAKKPVISTDTTGDVCFEEHPDGTGTLIITGKMRGRIERACRRDGITYKEFMKMALARLDQIPAKA